MAAYEEQRVIFTHFRVQPASELRRRLVMFGVCYTLIL